MPEFGVTVLGGRVLGAVALAALRTPAFAALREHGVIDPGTGVRRPIRSVAAVVCGGNVEPGRLCALIAEGQEQAS